jgi:hypothetical protein
MHEATIFVHDYPATSGLCSPLSRQRHDTYVDIDTRQKFLALPADLWVRGRPDEESESLTQRRRDAKTRKRSERQGDAVTLAVR